MTSGTTATPASTCLRPGLPTEHVQEVSISTDTVVLVPTKQRHETSTPAASTCRSSTARSGFIKDTISSWVITDPVNGLAAGTTAVPSPSPTSSGVAASYYGLTLSAGANVGVWQRLSTRNGGEVISSDQY